MFAMMLFIFDIFHQMESLDVAETTDSSVCVCVYTTLIQQP